MPYIDSANYELPYHAESETSRAAALKAKAFVGRQGLTVLAFFISRDTYGATQIEASTALNIGRPSMCARVRALEQQGELVKTDRRRAGCAVYTAA